jgi:signal transduction histidine kinase/CheY-like chemotaxis protein
MVDIGSLRTNMFGIFRRKFSTVIICLFAISLVFAIAFVSIISVNSIEEYNNYANKVTGKHIKNKAFHFLNVYTKNEAEKYSEIVEKTNTLLSILVDDIRNIYNNEEWLSSNNNLYSQGFKLLSQNGFFVNDSKEGVRTIYNSNFEVKSKIPDNIDEELNALSTIDPILIKVKNSSPIYNYVWVETISDCFKCFPSSTLLDPKLYPRSFKFRYSDKLKEKLFSKSNDEGYWTKIYVTPEKSLAFSRFYPIYNKEKYWGAVGVDIKLDKLFVSISPFLNEFSKSNTQVANEKEYISMIIDNQGNLVALNGSNDLNKIGIKGILLEDLNDYDDVEVNIKSSAYRGIAELNSKINGISRDSVINVGDEKYLFTFSPIKSTDWILVNMISEVRLLKAVVQMNKKLDNVENKMIIHYISIAIIFVIIFTSIAVLFLKNYLFVPLQNLIKGLKSISEKGDKKRIVVRGTGELRKAGDAFNEMIEELNISDRKIVHYQNHLENLVDERTAKINERIIIEQLLNSISHELLNVISKEDLDIALKSTIKKLGIFFDMNHIFVRILKDEMDLFKLEPYHWFSVNSKPITFRKFISLPLRDKMLKSKKPIVISDIKELPLNAVEEKRIMKEDSIISIIFIPMLLAGKLFGWLNLSSQTHKKEWSNEDVDLLQTIVGIITGTIERINYDQKIIKEKEKAEDATKAKSIFLANMSHDIRTPIHVILGNSDVLSSELADRKSIKKIKSIISSGKILLSLINNILDFSKIESGKIELNCRSVSFSALIKDLDLFFQNTIKNKHVDLIFSVDDNVPDSLILDPDYIKRILVNIISNAVKVTENGYVKVVVSCVERNKSDYIDLLIKVEDTGIGIEKSEIYKIFKPFEQVNNITGTGLGLSIAKEIVCKMGGDISVESKLGEGSVFNILLNNIKIDTSKNNKIADIKINKLKEENKIELNGVKILIADDIEDNRNLLKEYLAGTESNIIETVNGREVLDVLNETMPDIIILDYKMPVLDGVETIKEIRKKNIEIPIIVLSASALPETEFNAKRAGCNQFLRKPISKKEFIANLIEYLPTKLTCYNTKKPETEKLLDDFQINVPKEMMNELVENFLHEWEEIKDSFVITKYRDFIKKLDMLSEKYKSSSCKKWIDEISIELDSFRLNQVKEKFSEFDKLVEQIKSN